MGIEIGSVSSVSIAVAGKKALASTVGTASVSTLSQLGRAAIQSGSIAGSSSDSRIRLDRVTAERVLDQAVTAGNGIVSALKDLRIAVSVAGQSGLVSTTADVLIDGTRLSVLNIHAQMGLLLDRIDKLVKTAATDSGANLISSDAQPIRIQTTGFGGTLDVLPQPLDTPGLGIKGLDLLANGGINDARGRLDNAIVVAEQRLGRLEELQRSLSNTTLSRQMLSQALTGYGSDTLPRGSLVDLVA